MRARECILLVPTLLLAACGHVLGLPSARTHMVPMRDGTALAADVYLPDGPGPFPTVLMRTTYNKDAKAAGIKLAQAMGKPFVDDGYAFVAQDTRGRFASAGVDSIFLTDGVGPNQDGYDTIEWIVNQPWSNDSVGMLGMSALGITGYMAAASGHPALTCAVITAAGSNLYGDIFYPGGVYRQSMSDGWVTAQNRTAFLPFLYAHPDYDEVWRRVDLTARPESAHAAIYHWGGWFDCMSQGQTDAFRTLQERGGEGARGRQMLVMGPWSHGGVGPKQGELTYPSNGTAVNPAAETKAWFDRYLKGRPSAVDTLPAVRYYLMGDVSDSTAPGNVWMSAPTWPPPGMTPASYYLRADGLLATSAPGGEAPQSYRYDPRDPVPTKGGLNLFPPIGPADLRLNEARSDVLSFTTPPLERPVAIAGKVRVRLFASSSARDTDFMALLTDVYPDGRSMLVLDGAIRARHRVSMSRGDFLEPGEVYEFDINLWDTALVFNRGHRIRVDITSSNAPRFQPNPNTATPFRADGVGVVATNTIYHDREHPSALILPVIPLE